MEKYNIGLALSGGGAKGIAHAGVIKALEEHDLKPEILSGVSAGAIVAVLYADGKTPDEICQFFKKSKFFDYVQFVRPRKGLMSTRKFEKMLEDALTHKTFEELSIPVFINATELIDGRNVYFSSGSLVDKVTASASVPLFLTPKEIDGKMYVDGGIFNNMPVSIIRDKCKYQIGCHVNPIVQDTNMSNVRLIFERIYDLSIQSSTVPEKQICNLLFEPIEAKKFGIFDIEHTQEIFDIGYDYASKILDETKIELPM